MKKRTIMLLVFVLFLGMFQVTAYGAGVPQEVLDASQSVVYIESEMADGIISGSGFIIRNDTDGTYIVTNNHVIEENPKGVFVWMGENEKRSASVVASSEQFDLAVIKLSEPLTAAPLELSSDAKQGDDVYAAGFPAAANYLSSSEAHLSSEVTITDGIISSIRSMKNVDYGPDITLLQINADINEGNSGGPLLNAQGRVVGINTYGVMDAQGIFGAISAEELIGFLQDNALYKPASTGAAFPMWILFAAVGVVIVALLAVFLPKIIKRKKKSFKSLSLGEYLSRLDRSMDAYAAVSLMMPVILQIRDSHNNGVLYQKLSPARIIVKKDGYHLAKSNDNPTDEFLSPEQRAGGFAGVRSDVYAVCAMLRHTLEYHNKVSDGEAAPETDASIAALYEIIGKGLSEEAGQRQASMQELLSDLAPFNTGI